MTFYNAGCVKSSFFVHFASKIPTDFIPACQQTRLAAGYPFLKQAFLEIRFDGEPILRDE